MGKTPGLLLLCAALACGQIHSVHKARGVRDCAVCHVQERAGSAGLKRPGHAQCEGCHADRFAKREQAFCAECHAGSALVAYPQFHKPSAVLFEFSHARHVDPAARLDAKTGGRADCGYCHGPEPDGVAEKSPAHEQCAGCHAKPGFHPRFDLAGRGTECIGCHSTSEMPTGHMPSGRYPRIRFSHAAHLHENISCLTCHAPIPASTRLATLALPGMLECVACHDTAKLAVAARMSNCGLCHLDPVSGALPADHRRDVKPASHTESFREHHAAEAAAAGAKCFACHQNIGASAAAKDQCVSCHQVMRPESHTVRWKDDTHGKYAAIDRATCAVCHQVDYCSRCHSEVPRSHVPLPLFKNGGHATLALLDQRSCLTCHTFQKTCASCHGAGSPPASRRGSR